MMRLSVNIRPANSIIFIHSEPTKGWPLPIWGARILATNSAVSVTCMPEVDGSTQLVFGDMRDVGLDSLPDYEGVLRAAGDEVFITTVEGHVLLKMPVDELSLLKIWRSHPLWPEIVTVGIETVQDRWEAEQRLMSTDQATVTTIALTDVIESIFFSDGAIPSKYGDFNPWQFPRFLESGLLIKSGRAVELTVATETLKHLIRSPDIDAVLETPSGEVQIFDSHRGTALLKIDVQSKITRMRAWVERSAKADKITIVVPARF